MNEEHIVTEQTDQLDVQPSPRGGSKNRVLLGCGIGCGLLIFLAIVLGIGIYVLGNRALTQMDTMSKPYLEREYQAWKENDVITPERQAVYDPLYETVYDEELGSRWVTICVLFLMYYHTEDGQITDAEAADAQQLLDDIRAQPGLGIKYWSEFIESDPELQRISQKVPLLVREQ